jgi:crossover junction endodeoxyribonuclease RuvC
MRIIGIDPGLTHTGWGVIDEDRGRLSLVAAGRISAPVTQPVASRLACIHRDITALLDHYQPDGAAIEQTFVNNNPTSALKLGQARGVAMAALAIRGLTVGEYAANVIKKSVVGAGHADKTQIQMMVKILLPGVGDMAPDAADALAVAITHAHHGGAQAKVVGR